MQWMGMQLAGIHRKCGSLAQARWPWVFALLILGIHGLVEFTGGVQQSPQIYLAFGLRRAQVTSGAFWQCLTYACLHGSWLHVMLNALCVLILGARVEHILGSRFFLQILITGVLGGALGHLILADAGTDASPLVGISGACVAFLLVLATLSPESRMFPLPVSARSLGIGVLAAELLLALLNPSLGVPGLAPVGGWLVAHGLAGWFVISHACHVGGGVTGWLWGKWILRPPATLKQLHQARQRHEARKNRDV